jgi:hypothetical protein
MRKYTKDISTSGKQAVGYTIGKGSAETASNRMIHVMPNYTVHPILNDHPEISAKLRSCLRANILNNSEYSYIELHHHQIVTDWVCDLADYGYEIAVIWFDGSWPVGREFEETLLKLVDTRWPINWMAAGKINNERKEKNNFLNWDYSYPVVLNLKAWDIAGRPHFIDTPWKLRGQSISYDTPRTEDDVLEQNPALVYPSLWLDRVTFKNLNYRGLFVDGLISQSLENKNFVIGLDKTPVSKHIHSDIIEDEFDNLLTWIHNNDLLASEDIYALRANSDNMTEPRQELYTFKLLELQMVYITNTESVPKDFRGENNNNINTLVLPCSGLHQLYHLVHNRDSLERIVWFDFNPYSVAWIRNVIENWDGTNFKQFVADNRHTITDSGEINDECIIYDSDMVDEFFEIMDMSELEWCEFMTELRTKENKFATVNAVKEYKKLVDLVGIDKNVFIQLTNIWQYEVNYLNTDGFDAQIAFISLLNDISKNNKSVYLTGDTPMGTHYRYKNIKELKGIF